MRFCTSCGAELAEGVAFCAQCGASVPGAGQAAAPQPVVVPQPSLPSPESSPADKKSRKALLLSTGAILVVAAIVVGLLFIFNVFKSDNGSSSPEGAVAQLVKSVVAFTPSKALDAIAPGEISGFQGLENAAASPGLQSAVKNLQSQMKGSGGTPGLPNVFGAQLSALSGISSADITGSLKAVSVKLNNMQYTTTNLAAGIADVTITGGDITVSADSSKISANLKHKLSSVISGSSNVPSWVNSLLTGNTTVSHTWKIGDYLDRVTAQGQKLDAIVVQQDGGWHVSLYGTIAQHIYQGVAHQRQQGGGSALAQPTWSLYANPPKPIAAGSAEQVPESVAKAINDKSVMEIFQNLPQSEVRALYPYVPLIQTAADSGGNSGTPALSISGVQTTTTGTDGDLVHVTYTQATGTSVEGGQSKSASVSNGCYTVDGNKQCVTDWPDFAQTFAKVFGVDKGIPLTLRKVNGGYQWDPVGTYVGLVTSAMNHADDLVTAYGQLMAYLQKQVAQASSGDSSSDPSCYDSSGNYTC